MQRSNCRIELRRERVFQYIAPRCSLLRSKIGWTTTYFAPKRAQRRRAGTVVQQRVHLIHEVVATGAVHRPVIRQALTGAEDLLDDQPGWTLRRIRRPLARQFIESCAKPATVAGRISQTIDMIDPHTVEQPLLVKTQQRRVRRVEHRFILDTQSHQSVDVEEATPVGCVTRGAPPGKPVVLVFQKAMQPSPPRLRCRIERIGRRRGDLGMILRADRKFRVEVADEGAAVVPHQGDRAVPQGVAVHYCRGMVPAPCHARPSRYRKTSRSGSRDHVAARRPTRDFPSRLQPCGSARYRRSGQVRRHAAWRQGSAVQPRHQVPD